MTQELCLAFAKAFDESRLRQLLDRSDAEIETQYRLLGEGRKHRAFLLPSRTNGGDGLSLVFKRLKKPRGPERHPQTTAWKAALAQAQGVGGLIPPFAVLEQGDDVALVMPYGDQPLAAAAPAWCPLADHIAAMHRTLAARRLVLEDTLQGRCWRGIPFIFDLSDLRRSAPPGGVTSLWSR